MDRDPTTGRFVAGNAAAVGHRRPHAARVARFRTALMDAITEEDLAEIARALVDAAKGGDVQAARLLLIACSGRRRPSTCCNESRHLRS
ncbi:MAG TPA: hypothetical protein PKG51_11250 [Arachnia sp.]|nr:hypothetical protein [Arachnia sp.]